MPRVQVAFVCVFLLHILSTKPNTHLLCGLTDIVNVMNYLKVQLFFYQKGKSFLPKLNKQTVSHCFTVRGGPCHPTGFKQCSEREKSMDDFITSPCFSSKCYIL